MFDSSFTGADVIVVTAILALACFAKWAWLRGHRDDDDAQAPPAPWDWPASADRRPRPYDHAARPGAARRS